MTIASAGSHHSDFDVFNHAVKLFFFVFHRDFLRADCFLVVLFRFPGALKCWAALRGDPGWFVCHRLSCSLRAR
jgi:hypothetical protein